MLRALHIVLEGSVPPGHREVTVFDIFDFSDPLALAVVSLLIDEEEGQGRTIDITIDSPDRIDEVVAWVEENIGPDAAREVRRKLEEHFGLT